MVSGLVIGMRKSGTTWLYENFRRDPDFCVSEHTKESRFFTGDSILNNETYENLFDDLSKFLIEADASIYSAKGACDRIVQYNPKMKVVLILRDPASYLVSRYVHSFRKGEVAETDIEAAFVNHKWLRDELNYADVLSSFNFFDEKKQLCILFFDDLATNPSGFYNEVKSFMFSDKAYGDFTATDEVVNPSRVTSHRLLSKVLSSTAMAARKNGLHKLVNLGKSTGILAALERPSDLTEKEVLLERIEQFNNADFVKFKNQYQSLKDSL